MLFKKACVDCHFFHRQFRNVTGREHKLEVSLQHRQLTKAGDFSWKNEEEALGCYKGVWDEGHNFSARDMFRIIVEINRGKNCFYWPYQSGIFLPTAEMLFDRKQELRIATRNYRIAIYGLVLTIIGLVIAILKDKP